MLIHGDCLEKMKDIPNGYIDLVVTSPPYDDLRDYNGYSFDFKKIVNELFRITKDGGVIVWVVGDKTMNGSESGTSFRQALYFKDIGFNLHDTMIYEKSSPSLPNLKRYFQIFEYMFIFTKGKPKTCNLIKDRKNKTNGRETKRSYRAVSGERVIREDVQYTGEFSRRTNIWRYNVGLNNSTKDKIAFQHPAIFPEKLAEDHIISWSNEGDIVLDPFMGSGTTIKMAKILKRRYIGIETDKTYYDIAKKRIEDHKHL